MNVNFYEQDGKSTTPIYKLLFLGIIFIILGIFMIIIAILANISYYKESVNYKATTATVVGYNTDDDDKKALIVEFMVNNIKYRVASKTYFDEPAELNSQVNIKYNPNNPNEIAFSPGNTMLFFLIGLGIMTLGLLMLTTGINKIKAIKNALPLIIDKMTEQNTVDDPNNIQQQ
jgi:hypothetical protein